MRLASKKSPDVWMQLTSLIDVIFLLLIFFMCGTELNKLENETVTLPVAYKACVKEEPGGSRMVVTIAPAAAPEGWALRVQKKTYTAGELERLIAESAVAAGPDAAGGSAMAVKIRADAGCPYKRVQEVMAICARSGVRRLSFGASPGATTTAAPPRASG